MNNKLKAELISFAFENLKVIKFENHNKAVLDTSSFSITLKSNNKIEHTVTFDYHLKAKGVAVDLFGGNLTRTSFLEVSELVGKANQIRRDNAI